MHIGVRGRPEWRPCTKHPDEQVHSTMPHCNICQMDIDRRLDNAVAERRIAEQVEVFKRCVDYLLEILVKAFDA